MIYSGVKLPFFALAPMANITTYPFVSQAVSYGADLVWTPMVHTDTVINNWEEAEKILNLKDIGKYIVQLVGSDPEKFKEAILIVSRNLDPIGFDINAGCPDKNIVKSGCGGALLGKPELLFEIIKTVRETTKLPISVKTRLGWETTDQIFDLLPVFKKLGISMVTVHGRTVKQGFRGTADWEAIKKVKEGTDILVCGSGDIKGWKDAIEKQEYNGCDGVMIGRAALGKPWIFKEIKDQRSHKASLREIRSLVLDLATRADSIWGDQGITESKKHFAWYLKGFPGASEYRKKLMGAGTLNEVKDIIA